MVVGGDLALPGCGALLESTWWQEAQRRAVMRAMRNAERIARAAMAIRSNGAVAQVRSIVGTQARGQCRTARLAFWICPS